MKLRILGGLAVLVAFVFAFTLYVNRPARASDHQDSPVTIGRPGADITDPYAFPAPDNPNNVVLVMDVHPLIPPGQGLSTYFDPGVVYQMNFDGVDENQMTPAKAIVQSFILQFVAGQPGPNQQMFVYGPGYPAITGNQTKLIGLSGQGTINAPFTVGHMKVFAGAREEPFFFDLAQFLKILPDRNKGSDAPTVCPNWATTRVRRASTIRARTFSKATTCSHSSSRCRARTLLQAAAAAKSRIGLPPIRQAESRPSCESHHPNSHSSHCVQPSLWRLAVADPVPRIWQPVRILQTRLPRPAEAIRPTARRKRSETDPSNSWTG